MTTSMLLLPLGWRQSVHPDDPRQLARIWLGVVLFIWDDMHAGLAPEKTRAFFARPARIVWLHPVGVEFRVVAGPEDGESVSALERRREAESGIKF